MSEGSRLQLSDLPNLDLLYRDPEVQSNYVNKLRELARQHGQDMFLQKNVSPEKATMASVNLPAISPTPSASSSSSAGSNIRHFKKALLLQSNLEDAPTHLVPPAAQSDLSNDLKLLVSQFTGENVTPVKQPTAEKEEMNTTEAASFRVVIDPSLDVPPQPRQVTDFSIQSLSSSKYASEDESVSGSLLTSKGDTESTAEEDKLNLSKDDSLKEINPSQFDFLRPSTSSMNVTASSISMSANSSPSPSPSPSPSASPGPGVSFTTLPQMPLSITHVGRKPLNGPPCSLKTLVDDKILEPFDGSLSYEIMGSKFLGDLLPNGFIRMTNTSHVFANPSSWANFCRSTIASCSKDGKNYGSAWSIIRYLGKRLDSYKLRWYRKQKKQFTDNGVGLMPVERTGKRSSSSNGFGFSPVDVLHFGGSANGKQGRGRGGEMKNLFGLMNRERLFKLDKASTGDAELVDENIFDADVLNFASIDLNQREELLEESTRIGAVPFNSVLCLQPFTVTVSTNVLLLVDFHSHLSTCEVNGWLGGTWDSRTQQLTICQAYPLWFDEVETKEVQVGKIQASLRQKGLILVGWYHSHPNSTPQPSVSDIKKQLQYQKKMLNGPKGLIEYSPCVGLISSPYYPKASKSLFQMFWVMPIFSPNCRDFGRPMQLAYSTTRDAFLTQDLLVEMRLLATHLNSQETLVQFNDTFRPDVTYWDKLYESLKHKLPRDLIEPNDQTMQETIQQQALMHFWTFLRSLLRVTKVD